MFATFWSVFADYFARLARVNTEIRGQRSEIRGKGTGVRDQRSEIGWRSMRERERKVVRKRLDVEMRPFRWAGRGKNPTNGLLRAVRQALRVPAAEIAGKMGRNRSQVFALEASELKATITLGSMSRMAQAMGCKVVYGIVPRSGGTLEALAERRMWAEVLGGREQGNEGTGERGNKGTREQGNEGTGSEIVCRELGGFEVGLNLDRTK